MVHSVQIRLGAHPPPEAKTKPGSSCTLFFSLSQIGIGTLTVEILFPSGCQPTKTGERSNTNSGDCRREALGCWVSQVYAQTHRSALTPFSAAGSLIYFTQTSLVKLVKRALLAHLSFVNCQKSLVTPKKKKIQALQFLS